MKNKAFFDQHVFNKIIDLVFKHKNPTIPAKLINFISNTDCYVYPGYWMKNHKYNDFKVLISKKGRFIKPIHENEQIIDKLKHNIHFKVGVTSEPISNPLDCQVYTLEELISLMEENDSTCHQIKEGSAINDFLQIQIQHKPSSVIINDRYFFESAFPEKKIKFILDNLINKNFDGPLVITLFYSKNKEKDLDTNYWSEIILDNLAESFPAASFSLELIINTRNIINHDRFVITDFVCYKSTSSFSFLIDNTSSTIHRYLLYECPEFNSNIEFLNEFLKESKKYAIKSSNNKLIKSYLVEEKD